ncbi:hypothetical protein LQK93_04040 [Terrabacter sp. BE26]
MNPRTTVVGDAAVASLASTARNTANGATGRGTLTFAG